MAETYKSRIRRAALAEKAAAEQPWPFPTERPEEVEEPETVTMVRDGVETPVCNDASVGIMEALGWKLK